MEDDELNPEYAHPKARDLLTEEFYWSFEAITGPFGSDNAYDIFYSLLEWREDNAHVSPMIFIEEYMQDIGFPELDLKETDEAALLQYTNRYPAADSDFTEEFLLQTKSIVKQKAEEEGEVFDEQRFMEIITGVKPTSGINFLEDIDNLLITTGFGQFVIEGEVDKALLELTRIAIQREFLPMLLNLYDADDQELRKEQLHNMLAKLDKIG